MTRRSGPALLLALVVGLSAVVALVPGTDPAGAGTGADTGTGQLQIASVSPWVEPDGEFQVRFDPTSGVPEDAMLSVTIRQPLQPDEDGGLRTAVQDVIDGGASGRVLRAPFSVPLSSLGDPATGAVLTVPIRSKRGDAERVFLPNPGLHPVDLVLTSGDGPELWSQTVFLNRLPTSDVTAAPVRVTLVLPVSSGPAVATDGSDAFDVEEATALNAAGSLLDQVPGAPLTLAVQPNTLDGLARDEEVWAAELLDRLSDDDAGNVIAGLPYTTVDAASLVASGDTGELERQIVVGAAAVVNRLARYPTNTTWVAGESVSTEVLPTLSYANVGTILLPLDRLRLPDDVPSDLAVTSPVRLDGGDGIRALAYDTVVSQRLSDASVEPAVRAHQSVSLMMASWFAAAGAPDAPPLATAVLLAPTTEPAVLESLTSTLSSGGPLIAEPDAGPLPADVADDSATVAELAPLTTTDLRSAVAAANETRRQTAAYRSMTGDADPDVSLWDELTDQSMDAELDAGERAQTQATVRSAIAAKLALIEPPRSRRVLVTSDEQSIPLRFRNGLPFEVRLLMRARSPRLEIEPPTTEIVLAPGENLVDLPVTVQAPGESLLRIELFSPDNGIRVGGTAVPVRSSAISGVGAALSIVSVLFLCGWWFRTMRRHRRERAREGGAHPSGEAQTAAVPADRLGEGG